ncbi:hypothetical protein JRQ81_004707 [Phrynocephalus forsythii]|uniref:Uncharacterized protein n=1 Tax=Phrynocephalus forsythii TaxID=171643 RepID=A0A9Q0Y296_9SAUR|nr:hypothetical protein JRQ81_004707 [Phrynocephalus forsythii]
MGSTSRGPSRSLQQRATSQKPVSFPLMDLATAQQTRSASPSLEQQLIKDAADSFYDSGESDLPQPQVSPIHHHPMPNSDVVNEHPPSPSEDYKLYSQMVAKIAKILNLTIGQLPVDDDDRVFDDISLDLLPPLRLAFIKPLLHLIKELWEKLSTVWHKPHQVDNLYKTHGADTTLLQKHPFPNSFIVHATQNRTCNRSATA